MSKIIKRPTSGYGRHLQKKWRERALAPSKPAEVVFATDESVGVAIRIRGYDVDLTSTAINGFRSIQDQDRRAGVMNALMSVITRAAKAGEPLGTIEAAFEALHILDQVFAGDFSHTLIPKERKGGRPAKSEPQKARAYLMLLAVARSKMDGSELDEAAFAAVSDLHAALRPIINVWDVFPANGNTVTEAENLKVIAARVVRWIKAEGRKKPDREALPANSTAANMFAIVSERLERQTPSDDDYCDNLERCRDLTLKISDKAKSWLGQQQ